MICEILNHLAQTFRKKQHFEPVLEVKKRNAHYFWMSKRLRETVEVFGMNSVGKWNGQGDEYDLSQNRTNQILGPFFSGVSCVMPIPQFNIRLSSPTSTSKKIEVAFKFSGEDGMVIQLDNPESEGYGLGKGFDCSWISRFKEEDERLFFGGSWRIKIEGIILVESQVNFKNMFVCLTQFDGMVSGKAMKTDNIKHRDRDTLKKLIGHQLAVDKKQVTGNVQYLYQLS